MKQNDNRSELQQRIAAELQEKAKKKALETERPDGVTDSAYIHKTRQTSPLAGVWVAIALFAVGLVIWLIVSTAS